MADMEKDKQLDDQLESLLSTYSATEPRPGLETRILATLEAHAAQRQRRWIFALTASAAVVLLALLIANVRSSKEDTSVRTVPQKSLPEAGSDATKRVGPAPNAANIQFVHQRREQVENSGSDNAAILQMANVLSENSSVDNPVPEPDTPSLDPAPRQEPGPAIAQLTSTPNMSIRDLGVRAIEVKELNPAKDLD